MIHCRAKSRDFLFSKTFRNPSGHTQLASPCVQCDFKLEVKWLGLSLKIAGAILPFPMSPDDVESNIKYGDRFLAGREMFVFFSETSRPAVVYTYTPVIEYRGSFCGAKRLERETNRSFLPSAEVNN